MQELEYENLLGKPWVINQEDCFTLAINFYKQNFGIEIPNFARPNDWNADRIDLIKTCFPEAGFKITSDEWDQLRPADCLAMAIGSGNANHLAIYVGNNELIHHRFGVNSCKEPLRPAWRMSTMYILRHPDVPDLRPELPATPLEEILRARYTRETN